MKRIPSRADVYRILTALRPETAGFDHVQALREILQYMTYEQVAQACGYDSKRSLRYVLDGSVPSHPHGEMIYQVYVELFGVKPPLKVQQTAQLIAA